MAWSGSTYKKGNYSTNGWTGDAANNIGIEAGRHDVQDDDFAQGITDCINKNGLNTPTTNLSMGGFKHTNVANGAARNDYAALGQVQDGTPMWGGTSGGTANAQTLTPTPAITAYVAGQRFLFIAGFTNTAAATLNVNGVGAKNIFLQSTNAAAPTGYIRANQICEVVYDGTQFQLSQSSAELQSNSATYLGVSTGTANAIVLTPSPAITNASYTGCLGFYWFTKDATINTGACTININGLGAITLYDREGNALKAGMLNASRFYLIYLNGNSAYVMNPSSTWQGYTPTLSQGATVTFTTTESNYKLIDNNTVVWSFALTATSAGTASNHIQLTLPIIAGWSTAYSSIGDAVILKLAGTLIYSCSVALVSGSPGIIKFFSGSGGVANYVGVAPAITLASGDQISGTITYRV